MSDIRIRVHEGHHVSVIKEKRIDPKALEVLGICDTMIEEYLEDGEVEVGFEIENVIDPHYLHLNGYHVDDAIRELIEFSETFDEEEDWISDRKGYTEITLSFIKDGDKLWR
tara:strand:- start:771 stop:1106 length:336 start_codon:yes stop_codon:yes gene_type:complete